MCVIPKSAHFFFIIAASIKQKKKKEEEACILSVFACAGLHFKMLSWHFCVAFNYNAIFFPVSCFWLYSMLCITLATYRQMLCEFYVSHLLFFLFIFADNDALEKPHDLKEWWEHQGDTEGQPGLYPSTFYLQIWRVCVFVWKSVSAYMRQWLCCSYNLSLGCNTEFTGQNLKNLLFIFQLIATDGKQGAACDFSL